MSHTSAPQTVPLTHPALPGHFPDAPVVPGAWLLTLVEVFCRERFGAQAAVARLEHVRFRQPLRPGEAFSIHLDVEPDAGVRFRLEREGAIVAAGRLALRTLR